MTVSYATKLLRIRMKCGPELISSSIFGSSSSESAFALAGDAAVAEAPHPLTAMAALPLNRA